MPSAQMGVLLATIEQELGTGVWEPQARAVLKALRTPSAFTVQLLRNAYGGGGTTEDRDVWVAAQLGLLANLIDQVLL